VTWGNKEQKSSAAKSTEKERQVSIMTRLKPCEALSQQVQKLETEAFDHKRLQEELSVAYDALNSSASGVIITNLDGHITHVNPAFLKTFEYSEKTEVLGKNAALLFANGKEGKLSDIKTIIDTTKGATEQFTVQRKDTTTFPVEVSSSNVADHKGHIVGHMASFVDITERKRTEGDLQRLNEELKTFVNVVSHDLKQPIVAIQGISTLLAKKYQEKLDEKEMKYLEHIRMSATRMESLVSDLLMLARIGQVVSIFKDISASEVVKSVTANLKEAIEAKDLELIVEEDLPQIYCDPARIYQVFENLVINAIKFSRNSDHREVRIGYEDNEGYHQFFVKDNGIGIDSKYHQKIFDMFHRLRDVEDRTGTGLGLAIVEKIVSSHGGKVWVESEKGKGATFFFTLPKRSICL
jgi:PAS domain S-box-containing protein